MMQMNIDVRPSTATRFFNRGNRFIYMIYDAAFIPIVVPLLICYILSTCINIFSSIQGGCCFGGYNRDSCHFTI